MKPITIRNLNLNKVWKWKISFQLPDAECSEIKQPNFRLGSKTGHHYISCYDIYSNRMAFKIYPAHLDICVYKMEMLMKIKTEKESGCLIQRKMVLQISKILFGEQTR